MNVNLNALDTNFDLNVEHDFAGRSLRQRLSEGYEYKISLKQNIMEEFNSFIIPGTVMKISDCTISTKLSKDKSNGNFIADHKNDWDCNGKKRSDDTTSIKYINGEESSQYLVSYVHKSDYYEESFIKFQFDTFTTNSGLFLIAFKLFDHTAQELTYKLGFNELSIHTFSSFGSFSNKTCQYVRKSGKDYSNILSCDLYSTRVPNTKLTYGYKIDMLYHHNSTRDYSFELTVPGRIMKLSHNFSLSDLNEFKSTTTFNSNFEKAPSKSIKMLLSRQNISQGHTQTKIDFYDSPYFNSLNMKIMKVRSFDGTCFKYIIDYETKSGQKNSMFIEAKLNSGLIYNSFSLETNIDKPSFNTLYENRFNKFNGRLQYLGFRIGKVLQLAIDKEYSSQRKISIQFTNPDENIYQLDAKSSMYNDVYHVEGTLMQNSNQLSHIVSNFDANATNLDVRIFGHKSNNQYRFNFGVFDETLANAYIKNGDEVLGKASLQIVENQNNIHELVMSMKWNRFWKSIQQEIFGNTKQNLVQKDEKFNTYFGDVYSQLTNELGPIFLAKFNERDAIKTDIKNIGFIIVDFYSHFLPPQLRIRYRQMELQQVKMALRQKSVQKPKDLPLYKNVLRQYNEIAHKLNALNLKVRNYSKPLSKLVPRLPTYEYNMNSNGEYQNELVLKRPTHFARNLYQFNHEYRNYLRKTGQNILKFKRNLIGLNYAGSGIKALINKYKYRSLSDYTMVAHVFNKRNVIGFDGESVILQSRCKYLLAHETQKNTFSVILNFENNDFLISVYAYGQKSVDIGYNSAAIQNELTPLPRQFNLGDHGSLDVRRTNDAVCVELNHDLKVCCYNDSKSCTIAVTRWFTGKLNGLLGKADNNPEKINSEEWLLDNQCKKFQIKSRETTQAVVDTCYSIFGRHRKSTFRDALEVISLLFLTS